MERDNGGFGLIVLLIMAVGIVLLGLAMFSGITEHQARQAEAQAVIVREQQAGETQRAQAFNLALAGIVAMTTQQGPMMLITLALVAGLFYMMWRDTKR